MLRRLFLTLSIAAAAFGQSLPAQLDAHVLSYVAQDKFTGAVLVARDGKPVLERAYGMANREWSVPNTVDTKFRLGSITKQFTAALILQLEENGKLSVGDPVSKYVTDCPPAWDKVTIHHLLSHTSGIPNFTSFPDYGKTKSLPVTAAALVDRFRSKPLEFEPGAKWNYSNSGYVLLGYIIEKVAEKPYAEVLRANILDPLGMKDTGYDDPKTILHGRASGYEPKDKGWRNADYIDMTVPHAAGAMYSTVGDLLKWDQSFYDGPQILSAASKAKMFTPVKNNYAYGWGVEKQGAHNRVSHGGGIDGFATWIARFPDDRLTIVILSNNEAAPAGKVGNELATLAFGEKIPQPKTHTAVKIKPDVFDAYAGRYELAPGFVMNFWREGETFWTQATGQPTAEIFPESETTFFLKIVDAQVTFVTDATGKATGLVLHQNGEHEAKRLP
jgi:D-alanyl-D-alanine carboxypeptidase